MGIRVGGTYSGTITNNTYTSGANIGEVLFGAGTFTHPNTTTYTYASPVGLATPLEVSYTNTMFLMFGGSDMTRFPNRDGGDNSPFRLVKYIGGAWRYYGNDSNYYTFTPNVNDAIVGYIAKTTTSGGYDVLSLGTYPFTLSAS